MTSAIDAHRSAKPGNGITGWLLDPEQRKELLLQFPPRFEEVVAHHVTLSVRVAKGSPLPSETVGEIVGRADDGQGVEAMVVSIGGTTGRPDGSTYHITWSLGAGRHARESNGVIAELGWEPIELPMPVRLRPTRLR